MRYLVRGVKFYVATTTTSPILRKVGDESAEFTHDPSDELRDDIAGRVYGA